MNEEQIIFEKLTVEEQGKVRGGEISPDPEPAQEGISCHCWRPNFHCIP